MRYLLMVMVALPCLLLLASIKPQPRPAIGAKAATEYFRTNAKLFAATTLELQAAIQAIDSTQPQTIAKARASLKACRLAFKRIELFLDYFFPSNATFFNRAPTVEVEEPFMEWETPTGLQVIESQLYDQTPSAHKAALMEQADALSSSATDLPALLYNTIVDDKQVLESIRLELIRVSTLGITGYDAPLAKSGIDESATSFEALQVVLKPYLDSNAPGADSVALLIDSTIRFLHTDNDFDGFDRLAFLTNHVLPLQQALGTLIRRSGLELNTTAGVLNYNAPNLYSRNAINANAFPRRSSMATSSLVLLGRRLFHETMLSGNNKISCATCHQPDRHFTETLPKSMAFNGHSTLERNAPSILYSAYQYGQFWDGRAKSLEDQVQTVLTNRSEMNGDASNNISKITRHHAYAALFNKAFPGPADTLQAIDKVAIAIAAFIRNLDFRNSPFDRYMQGEKSMLSPQQQHGFNLFMGKAQCGTCHFAPLFNGLLPPLYNRTEVEVLGTTQTDDFEHPIIDQDLGRYNAFQIEFYEHAFKTPTVRNASATAPYMHNGGMGTLEKVVEFYNKGGGLGMGLPVTNQSLSPMPLQLTEKEISDLIAFMKSLEDDLKTHP